MLAQNLKAILDDKVLKSSKSGDLTLKEKKSAQKVDVFKLPSDAVVIDLERFGSFSGVRDGSWKQRCDFMLVFQGDETDRVLFVELKKTLNGNESKGFEQLRLSLPLLKYLDSVCELHFETASDRRAPIVRYVLIGEQGSQKLDKQPVRSVHKPCSERHKGITVKVLVGPSFGFSHLWAG